MDKLSLLSSHYSENKVLSFKIEEGETNNFGLWKYEEIKKSMKAEEKFKTEFTSVIAEIYKVDMK